MSVRTLFVAMIATSSMLATTMGVAGAQTSTACGTAPAGYNVIEANTRFIVGTPGNDFICAGDGNNIIRARGMNDIIHGGGGNDVIWAGYGNDTVYGGDGDDLIRAGGGLDTVFAQAGDDRVLAGSGPDVVRGGDGADTLTGGDGHDRLYGDSGADKLIGNKGIDRLWGGADRDVLQGGIGPDTLNGGSGNDTLTGGDHDDVLGGGDGDDRLVGSNGKDILTGGNGDDVLLGGGNPDVLRGSNGDDFLDGGNGLNIGVGGGDNDECLNVDDPSSSCEIIDGIDLAALPARIIVNFPATAGPVVIEGIGWTPNTDIDVLRPLIDGAEQGTPVTVVDSDADGDFTLSLTIEEMAGRFVRIEDSAAGRIKTLEPILDDYSYVGATRTLTVFGPADGVVEAFVRNPNGELIFVEQMTIGAGGSAETDFREITDTMGSIDLVRTDGDGDKELHESIWSAA